MKRIHREIRKVEKKLTNEGIDDDFKQMINGACMNLHSAVKSLEDTKREERQKKYDLESKFQFFFD